MTNYQNGKIYKIISPSTGLTYYGCTTQTLPKRWYEHNKLSRRSDDSRVANRVLNCGDAKIYLVELYPCNSKDELRAREGYYQLNFECVNNYIAGRDVKQWRINNKEHMQQWAKDYRNKNREHIQKYMKQWHQNNKDEQDKIKRSKLMCECGAVVSKTHMTRHQKESKQHQQYMLNPLSHF